MRKRNEGVQKGILFFVQIIIQHSRILALHIFVYSTGI